MIESHADVIDLWQSPVEFAAALQQKPDTCRRWRLRNNIPATFWPSVEAAAAARGFEGVTVARLAATARERGPVGRPARAAPPASAAE